jgi:chromosome partitioning protein
VSSSPPRFEAAGFIFGGGATGTSSSKSGAACDVRPHFEQGTPDIHDGFRQWGQAAILADDTKCSAENFPLLGRATYACPMILALVGQKGGIGKSTTAICLAARGLEREKRVLLVDADPQGTARTWGAVASESGIAAPTIVAMGATMHRPGQLADIARGYDLVVIDCPPRHGDVQRAALMIADVAILPCGPSAADAWALASSLELIAEARTLREELKACVVLTRKQGRTALGKGARRVLETSGLPVMSSELAYRIAYQEAIAVGRGVTSYAPKDRAAYEVCSLFDELERFSHGQEASGCFAPQAAAAG